MALNVFIAIGGTGAKVAEALVRLLTIGVPTERDENGVLTSKGHKLEIWHLDSDLQSASKTTLESAVSDYCFVQDQLSSAAPDAPEQKKRDVALASSGWAMDLDRTVRHLNPLLLKSAAVGDNTTPTLKGLLDSDLPGVNKSKPLLDLFYEDKDLELVINKGFYQKPFIGAAVMGLFVESLNTEGTDAFKQCDITRFDNKPARFFLCGSLHGGTGASGLPILGSYLQQKKQKSGNKDWLIGAGLLAPYAKPGGAPYKRLKPGEPLTAEAMHACIETLKVSEKFRDLDDHSREALAWQLLNGFYADPTELDSRAAQGFRYFRDRVAKDFSAVYLAGKKVPDELAEWSNGGDGQKNASNTTEIIMALAAINFFAGSAPTRSQTCFVPSATVASESRTSGGLYPSEVPLIEVPKHGIAKEKDAVRLERVLLATSVLAHLVLQTVPWNESTRDKWPNLDNLWKYYEHDPQRRFADHTAFIQSFATIKAAMDALLGEATKGWEEGSGDGLNQYFSSARSDVDRIEKLLEAPRKKYAGLGAEIKKDPLEYRINNDDKLSTKLTTDVIKFGQWGTSSTEPTLNKGAYLRLCWSKLYDLCK